MSTPVTCVVTTRHGRMLALTGDVYITRSLQVYGEYCPDEARALVSMIQPGATVIEVGANIGAHTVGLAKHCAPGVLYAFEPQHRVFQILCANLAANGVANVVAYPEASGARAGWATMPDVRYDRVGNFGNVAPHAVDQSAPGQKVRVTPIDDLPLEACGLIKIDVEGWESDVLRGAEQTIRRFRPVLYVENDRHDRQGALIEQVAGYGYRLYWHTPALYSPDNFNGVQEDVFARVGSLNMLCVPAEDPREIRGLPLIDPANWSSPF